MAATSKLLLSTIALCFSDSCAATAAAPAAQLRVAVSGDDCPKPVCAALLGALVNADLVPTQIDNVALAKLSKTDYDVLVLPNAPAFPAEAAPAYFSFAKAGGHIAVLGGRPPRLNITASFASLNLMDTYEPYRLKHAVLVEPLPAASAICGSAPSSTAGAVSGLSAIGFARQGQSAFVPLLHAVDKHNRSVGWALSAMVHTGGPYNGSVWLLSGIKEHAFLTSPSFATTLATALAGGAKSPSIISAAAATFQAAGLASQTAAATAIGASTSPSPPGFIKTGRPANIKPDSKHLMYASDGSRYFMLGGDYFRGMFNSSLDAETLAIDLRNAVLSGLNTLRFYGFPASLVAPAGQELGGSGGATTNAVMELLRQMHKDHGLRILFTLPAYKDNAQKSKGTVIARTKADASILANETWVLGYDLANEPDDQYNWPGVLIADEATNQTLNDLYPAAQHGWGEYEKAQCGGWSTTFDPDHCGTIDSPILDGSLLAQHPELRAGFSNMSSIFGEWIQWRVGAIKSVDKHHLITVGNNALHALLPSNEMLDFVSHHSYPSDAPGNASCTMAQFYNVTAVPKTLDIMHKLFPDQPITYGEFGSKTTAGLWEMYEAPLSVDVLPPSPPSPPPPPSGPGCNLPEDCVTGVASTIRWYFNPPQSSGQKPQSCASAWALAVKDNAGPGSHHHRCPAWAGTTFKGNPFYTNCEHKIIAAAANASNTCDPSQPSGADDSCTSLSIYDGAVWDIMSWLHAIAHGYDGGLRWAIAEKPWVIGAQQNIWVGDYTADSPAGFKAYDDYVSNSKWGSTWYDGSPTGRLKPIALTTRFLSQYLAMSPHWSDPAKYRLTYVPSAPSRSGTGNRLGGGYQFVGPDCVFGGGPSGSVDVSTAAATFAQTDRRAASEAATSVLPMLQWKTDAGTAANVMLYSAEPASGNLTGQSSADATVTISPSPFSNSPFERALAEAWNSSTEARETRGPRVEGRVGGFRWFLTSRSDAFLSPAIEVEALEGEVFTVVLYDK